MKFEASGKVVGELITVAWQDGILTGNGQAIRLALIEAAKLEGEPLGLIGRQTTTKHLRNAFSAKEIIGRVLVDAVYTGDVPETDNAPPGAVI